MNSNAIILVAENGVKARKRTTVTRTEIPDNDDNQIGKRWKRIFLLVVAVTVHNIPEGLAVGVGFGASGRSAHSTFESARYVAAFFSHVIVYSLFQSNILGFQQNLG